MRKLPFLAALLLSVVTAVACTDAQRAQWTALGDSGHIKCYSGGVLIYEGDSTGKISTEQSSDGWFLKDEKTGKLIRVSGDCVIEN